MTPDDIEFIAENELIEIICNFNSPEINLIKGTVGPFRAGLTTLVPLWLAVDLKQKNMCKIVPPSWMSLTALEAYKEEEKGSKTFTKMPSNHYMEVAKLLLDCSFDDIPQAAEIRTLVKDLWDMRMAKIRNSVTALVREGSYFASLNHLTMFEINTMLPLFPFSLNHIMRIKKGDVNFGSQRQSSNSLLLNSESTL